VKAAVKLLMDDAYWRDRSAACLNHAQSWDASVVADRFLALVAGSDRR
jgi:hypothetical protein